MGADEVEGPDFSKPLTGDEIEVMMRRVALRQHNRVLEMQEVEQALAKADVAYKRALLVAKHTIREKARQGGVRITESYISDEAEYQALDAYEAHRLLEGQLPPLKKAFDADQSRQEALRSLLSRAKEWERG